MSDSIGKVTMDLETNAGPFQRQLNGIAGKSTNMVTSAFKKMGLAFAGAFAVKKLVDFGKAAINMASDLEEVQNVVDVVFGKSSSQINNFAKTALSAYGLSELSAKRYASTMGAMLKSMGLSEQATLNMSQSITALAGDMASFYNLDGDDAFNKIRAGISGETEPLKQLGINMSQVNLEAYAMSQGITKSFQKMSQSEQALLRYNYLLSVTADAQGDFARTSDGWANQTRVLTEQFNSLKATLGSAFITMLTPVVKMLNWVISKLQIAAAYFKAFVSAFAGVKSESKDASSGMSSVADSAVEAGEATEKAAKKASKSLAGFDKLNVLSSSGGDSGSDSSGGGGGASMDVPEFTMPNMTIPEPDTSGAEKAVNKIKSMFDSLKSYITTSFAPSIKSWGKAFEGLKQPIQNAYTSIGNSTKTLWESSLKPFGDYLLTDFVPNIVNSFSETVAPIFTEEMSFAIGQFASDFQFACGLISALINDIYLPTLDLMKNITIEIFTLISDEWTKNGTKLLNMFGKFRDSVKEIISSLYNTIIKPVWQSIVKAVDELWDKHLSGLVQSILSFFSKTAEAIMTVWNNALAPLVEWIIKTFGPAITSIFNGLLTIVKNVIGNIVDAVKSLFNALGGLMDFITGVFSGNWKKAWQGIKDFFKGIWDALVNIVKAPINLIIGLINGLVDAVAKGLNLIIKGVNKLSFTVPDWVPGIGGKKFGFDLREIVYSKIPYLAEGGIIEQPTLAMVGERGKEAVVPLENTDFADSIANAILRVLTPLFAKGGSIGKNDDGTTVIVLKVGEYELGRVTVGAINKYHNIVGKVELEV